MSHRSRSAFPAPGAYPTRSPSSKPRPSNELQGRQVVPYQWKISSSSPGATANVPVGHPSRPTASRPRVAAIDIGTNSVRLLVAERGARGEVRPLVRLGESCRLGEGMEATGKIGTRAEERTRETVARFARRARELECVEVEVAAPNALRS